MDKETDKYEIIDQYIVTQLHAYVKEHGSLAKLSMLNEPLYAEIKNQANRYGVTVPNYIKFFGFEYKGKKERKKQRKNKRK